MIHKSGTFVRKEFTLSYSIEGQGPDTLVIGSALYYPKTFSQNLRKHLKLICMDHRGFGERHEIVPESEYNLDVIAEDIEAFRKELGIEKLILVGHSGHAYMAIRYAIKYPQHVSHLVIAAISPKESFQEGDNYFEKIASPERKALLTKNMANSKNDFIGRMLTFGPMLWYQYDYDATDLWDGLHVNPEIVGYLWGKLFMEIDISDDAEKIQAPVFVVLGKYDFFNPPYLWDEIRKKFKDITIKVIEQAGHTPQLEKPEEFDSELLAWLSSKTT